MSPDNTSARPQQVQCILEDLGIVTFDGKRTQVRLFKHSDGFNCLHLAEVDEDVPGAELDQNENPTF